MQDQYFEANEASLGSPASNKTWYVVLLALLTLAMFAGAFFDSSRNRLEYVIIGVVLAALSIALSRQKLPTKILFRVSDDRIRVEAEPKDADIRHVEWAIAPLQKIIVIPADPQSGVVSNAESHLRFTSRYIANVDMLVNWSRSGTYKNIVVLSYPITVLGKTAKKDIVLSPKDQEGFAQAINQRRVALGLEAVPVEK